MVGFEVAPDSSVNGPLEAAANRLQIKDEGANRHPFGQQNRVGIWRRVPSNSSWTGCAKSLADRMDLRPSSTRRYVLDSITRIAHSFLCTCRSTVSGTYLVGPGKAKTRADSEAHATDKTRMLNRSGTARVLKICIIQVVPARIALGLKGYLHLGQNR